MGKRRRKYEEENWKVKEKWKAEKFKE